MDAARVALVGNRAKHRCEYCHFPEAFAEMPFQIDHVVALQHGGGTEAENLALACCFCNRYKGHNLSGVDPKTHEVTRLFNPRSQNWSEHFTWQGPILIGKGPIGRATVQALSINRPEAVAVRQLLMDEGVYPC